MRVESKAAAETNAAPVLQKTTTIRAIVFCPSARVLLALRSFPPKKFKIWRKRTKYISLRRLRITVTLEFRHDTWVHRRAWMKVSASIYNAWMYGVLDAGL